MKLVASDFDGTLYRNGTVTEEEKQAISQWRKNGNLFGVVTGRNYRFLRADLDGFNIEYDFIISTNGALIRDNKENVVQSSEGDISVAKEMNRTILAVIAGFAMFLPTSSQFRQNYTMATWQTENLLP